MVKQLKSLAAIRVRKTRRSLQKVHWKAFIEKRVVLCITLVIISKVAERSLHFHQFAAAGELLAASLLDHLLFGITLWD